MENDEEKRSRFRIHLSTAVVLMFTASFIIWMNVIPENPCSVSIVRGVDGFKFGWPIQFIFYLGMGHYNPPGFHIKAWYFNFWFPPAIVLNVIINCAILCMVAVFFERRIRNPMVSVSTGRRWFHAHWVTKLCTRSVAVLFVFSNVVPQSVDCEWTYTLVVRNVRIRDPAEAYGCPFIYYFKLPWNYSDWVFDRLLLNIAILIVVVAGIASVCEWITRRRAPRTTSS